MFLLTWLPSAQGQQGAVFEGFGNRLVPEGVPGDHGAHRNRSAAQMAGMRRFVLTCQLQSNLDTA